MITPPPQVMENESGREFRIEIGRYEKPEDELSQMPESGEASPENKLKKEPSTKQESGDFPPEPQP